MIAVSVNNLSFSRGTVPILENVSFALNENDRLGIIGINGCGKSTLLRLLAGLEEPDKGEVYISKGKTVGFLSQDAAFAFENAEETVTERMWRAFPRFLETERKLAGLESLLQTDDPRVIRDYTELHDAYIRDGGLEFRNRCRATLQKLGFDDTAAEQKVSTLSGGQKTRLSLAVELCREPDILMLDEPTNHLDIETLAWLEGVLCTYPKCVLIVSHDRYFLDRVTTKTLSMEHCHAKLYRGGYTASMEQRRVDREIAERHWKNQQKEIARQEAYIAQQRAWNRERNIIAAESRQKQLDKLERLERPEADPRAIRMRFGEAVASGNDVLEVRNLTMGFPGRTLFSDISFLVKRQERVLIIGPNGCGKSTLIKLLLHQLPPLSGTVEEGYHVEVGYYDQENQKLTPENTVLNELWNAYPTLPETQIRNTLALFRFFGDDVFKQVSVLSGGERARLTLSKLMLSKMNLLILDEPTNHLDIDSREALEEALRLFEGTVVTVSHDRYLIEKLATRILELRPGAPFRGDLLDYQVDHAGNAYTEFRTYKTARIAEAAEARTGAAPNAAAPLPGSNKEQYLRKKQADADARKRKAQTERLRRECEALETELSEIEKELFGSAASDYVRAAELEARKAEAEERLMEIYEILEASTDET